MVQQKQRRWERRTGTNCGNVSAAWRLRPAKREPASPETIERIQSHNLDLANDYVLNDQLIYTERLWELAREAAGLYARTHRVEPDRVRIAFYEPDRQDPRFDMTLDILNSE